MLECWFSGVFTKSSGTICFYCYTAGTGHGVGAALNVHEGPQSVSARFGNMTGLQAGMIISNEPGYYEDRAFGIRIEVPLDLWQAQMDCKMQKLRDS